MDRTSQEKNMQWTGDNNSEQTIKIKIVQSYFYQSKHDHSIHFNIEHSPNRYMFMKFIIKLKSN